MTKLKRTTHKAQGFAATQTQGYCLLPHHHSAIAITNRLTGSQFRLWHYLMMIDPFADHNRKGEVVFHDIPSPTELGKAIGSSPRTVEKDMERLEELGLYAKRIKSWQGYNLTAEEGRKASERMKKKTPKPLQEESGYLAEDTAKQPDAALNSRNGGYLTESAAKQPDAALNNRSLNLEPPADKASSTPHTIQTYSDFIHTLSDSERENFEKYVREEWKRMTTRNGQPGEEIVSLERFLAREEDLQNWHQRFLKSPAGKVAKKEAIASTHDWRNDPRFDSWIWEAFNRGYEWIHENEAEREQRRTFCDWAHQVDAYEVCVKAIYGSEEVSA